MAKTWSPLLSSCMMMDCAASPEEVEKAMGEREGDNIIHLPPRLGAVEG